MDNTSFAEVKANIHRVLLSQLDLEKLSTIHNGRARQAVSDLIQEILVKEKLLLNGTEKDQLQTDLLDEVFGYGPLEPLLKDPTISDILVNRRDLVYVERSGVLSRADTAFRDDRHLLQIIDRIVGAVGRRVDESSPMVDARLPDGSLILATADMSRPCLCNSSLRKVCPILNRTFSTIRLLLSRAMNTRTTENVISSSAMTPSGKLPFARSTTIIGRPAGAAKP